MTKLIELPDSLKRSYNEATLNYITEILYEICSLYNKFYTNYNIINEEDAITKNTYIAVSNLTLNTIKEILNILAIDTIDKM